MSEVLYRWNMMVQGHMSDRVVAVANAEKTRRYAGTKARLMAAKKENILEMFIYGQIGQTWYEDGVTAAGVAKELKDGGKVDRIALRINSPGGSVFEGAAIYTQLRAAGVPINVRVDGLAASAAFTIAMAGDTIEIGEAAMMMLHNAWGMAMGESSDMRKEADLLDQIGVQMAGIYAKRSGQTLEDVQAMMNEETWFSPKDAVEKGFANSVITSDGESAKAAAKHWNMAKFAKAVPKDLEADDVCECPCPSCANDDCAGCTVADCDYDGCDHDPDMRSTQEPIVAVVAPDLSMYERRCRLAALNL